MAERFVLKDQSGRRHGPVFSRYQDAFNGRVSLNRPGLRVVEAICDEGCTDPEYCEHPAPGFRYRDYPGQGVN